MAADTRSMSDGWIVSENCTKVYRLSDGSVVGFTGHGTFWIKKFIDWYEGDRTLTLDLKDEWFALVATPNGKLLYYCGDGYQDISNEPFGAIGSGAPAARAALLMGCNAVEAVRIASQCDPNTGPIVYALEVEELK